MTKKQKLAESKRLQKASLNTSRLGFVFIAIYAATVLIYKLWKLVTPNILQQKLFVIIIMTMVTLSIWWFSRIRKLAPSTYKVLIFLQALMYIIVAGYNIYTERGMASNSIILFVIPLTVVALAFNGKSLLATALISSAVYAGVAIKYFMNFPSEGYKVELYGGIVFYTSIIYLISAMLWLLIRSRQQRIS